MTYFGAGPSKTPNEVLLEVQSEMLDYAGTGLSVMEISHRSPTFFDIITRAERDVRELLQVPESYAVLFLQGGATGQFAAVPLNLCVNNKADYLVTGTWSQKAATEARRFTDVSVVFNNFSSVPNDSDITPRPDADYLFYCDNETVGGVEFGFVPETGDVPLVADISSNVLTRAIDVSKFAVLFAGAQKNLGPAGVTLVIVRPDILQLPASRCPDILRYASMHKAKSILNTPPCFNIYVLGKVLDWVKRQGGVEEMQKRSAKKSQLIYDVIDTSNGFYVSPIDRSARSRTTITLQFSAGSSMEENFLKQAEAKGLNALKGHRSVGGVRAALFNAISVAQTEALAAFMEQFHQSQSSH